MFCKNCGKKLDENVSFCGRCGTRAVKPEPKPIEQPVPVVKEIVCQEPIAQQPIVESVAQEVLQDSAQSTEIQVAKPEEKKKKTKSKKKKWLLIMAIVLAICIVLGALYVIFVNQGEIEEETRVTIEAVTRGAVFKQFTTEYDIQISDFSISCESIEIIGVTYRVEGEFIAAYSFDRYKGSFVVTMTSFNYMVTSCQVTLEQ